MRKIIERPITVLMVHVALVALAYFELSHLPIELSPESDFPRLSIVTSYPGASSELVVQSVTLPIEEAASTLDEVKEISSSTRQGQSIVDVQLQRNANVDLARLNLLEKLSAVTSHFPAGAGFPRIEKYVPEDFRQLQGFMTYTIYGDRSLLQIQKFAEDDIKARILSVRGVTSARILGGARRQLYVLVNRDRMQAFGVRFQNVAAALEENGYVEANGELVDGNVRQSLLTGSTIKDVKDINEIMVQGSRGEEKGGSGGGRAVRLSDFAKAVDSISTPAAIVRINGEPSVTIEIDKELGINMLKVSSDVDAKMVEIEKDLPSGLHIEKVSDRSEDVTREINGLLSKALYAGLLILAIVFLFYFQRKSVLWKFLQSIIMVVSVVFSIGAGVIFLAVSGIGLNVITLAALALSLGIAIDNNVVVSESIYREFERVEMGDLAMVSNGEGGKARYGALIVKAAAQVWLPLVAATLTTVGAFLPVFFIPSELRTFFIPFAEVSAFVIISSLVVAFTFLPVAMMLLMSRERSTISQRSEQKTLSFLKRVYMPTAKWLITHKKTSIAFVIWLIGIPIWLLPESISYDRSAISSQPSVKERVIGVIAAAYNSIFESEFYGNIRTYIDYGLGGATQLFFKHVYKSELWQFGSETHLIMSVYAPQGTPIENIDQFAKQMENGVLPSKRWITRMTTRVTPEYSSMRIDFADSVAQTPIPFIIKDELTSLAAQAGGLTVSVSGFGPGFYSGGETSPNFTITVTGYNYQSVREIAENVKTILVQNSRVDNVQVDRLPWKSANYEIHGDINRSYLSSLGISAGDFINHLTPFVSSSLQRSSLPIENQQIDLVVKCDDYSDKSTENLPSQRIDLGGGKMLNIGNAIEFKKTLVMPVIGRDNRQYIRYITFDFKGPYKYGDIFTDEVVKSISTPPGYEVRRSNYWFTFEPKEAIPLVLLSMLAILIVFMVTASLYESYKKPFIVILSAPMSLIGLFATFFFVDANFGRGGYAAVLFLIGLSVNNGILLVDKIGSTLVEKEKGERGMEKGRRRDERIWGDREKAAVIAEAALERLRPILMTTVVTVAGFAPFVINADVYSFWYSFSLGVTGGVVVSSLMVLLFTPVFFDLLVKREHSANSHALQASMSDKEG